MYRRTKHSNHHDLFPGFKSPSFRKMHLYHVITALSIILFLTGPCLQSAAHPAAKGTAAHKSDLHALTRITGIVRYYSPNPYTAGWNSFDWFFIEYSRFKALEQGQTLETVLRLSAGSRSLTHAHLRTASRKRSTVTGCTTAAGKCRFPPMRGFS